MAPCDVLLVDDSLDDIELALDALRKRRPGTRVSVARDGVEALDALFGAEGRPGLRPRLVLLDLKMPRVDGLEVLRRLKADPGTRPIPVVMLTSSGEDRDVAACYRLGANGYVVKPVAFNSFDEAAGAIAAFWLGHNHAHRADM